MKNKIIIVLLVNFLLGIAWVHAASLPQQIIATYEFKPHHLSKIQRLIKNLVKSTRQQQGNIAYTVIPQLKDNRFTFVELWTSAKAHQSHLHSASFIKAHKQLDPLLAKKPKITVRSFSIANPLIKNTKLYQVATIGSLARGVYHSHYSFRDLMTHGDLGLGTFEHLDGEMVALDGKYFQIRASGKLVRVSPKQTTPFAQVIHFHPTIFGKLDHIRNISMINSSLNSLISNKNIPYAIRIDGHFNALKLRSLRKQSRPYPVLTQAAKEQAIFYLKNVPGSIVGFWFPQYFAGIAVPQLHLHFVTKNEKTGGHVLALNIRQAKISLQPIYDVSIHLLNNKLFAKANLSAESLHRDIRAAEGDH